MGGIAQAFADSVPILYLTAGPALDRYAVRPDFSPVRTYQSVSKRGEVIACNPVRLPAQCAARFMPSVTELPGPVIIEVPIDMDGQEVPEGTANYQPPRRSPQHPSINDVKDSVRLLLNAKKPSDMVGKGSIVFGRNR